MTVYEIDPEQTNRFPFDEMISVGALIPVEIDYKAAYTAYDEHGSNMSDPSLAALRAAIDAALGIVCDD